jgi:hypothetical protein
MPTTTNYGWTTPADTDLVKDGASAIRTLGTAIDTTTKNLNPETTLGDIAYRSSTANTNTRLALGTAGQVLTVNSGATAPEWATPSSGGMTSIATGTLSGASVVISSIPSTYNDLFLELENHYPNTGGYGTDVTVTGQTDYQGIYVWNANGSVATAAAYATSISRDASYALAATNQNNYVGIRFLNYAGSTKKVFQCYGRTQRPTQGPYITFVNTSLNNTAAISSITIANEGGSVTFGGGTYTLWGIK